MPLVFLKKRVFVLGGRRNEQQFVYHIQYSPRTYPTLFSLEEKLIPEIFPHGSRILTTDSSTKEFQPLLLEADYIFGEHRIHFFF